MESDEAKNCLVKIFQFRFCNLQVAKIFYYLLIPKSLVWLKVVDFCFCLLQFSHRSN